LNEVLTDETNVNRGEDYAQAKPCILLKQAPQTIPVIPDIFNKLPKGVIQKAHYRILDYPKHWKKK